MWKRFKYGPGLKLVRLELRLSWPLIKYGKTLSNVPVLKWIIYPFFKHPCNELTSIPIHVNVESPDSVALPMKLVERLLAEIDDIFLMDECHCAGVKNRASSRLHIGCLALGPAIARIHPSHGRRISADQAVDHVQKAAAEGLVANIAHVWIDALAFQLTRFSQLLFMCFCDDDQCIYRSHMKHRGPSLGRTYKKLPGLSVQVDIQKCTQCETCVETCFMSAIAIEDNSAVIQDTCIGCGICISQCSAEAITMTIEDEDTMFNQLLDRVREMSNLPLRMDQNLEKNE
ncbi:hypothetical protein KKI24_04420 [bacterium]|nr:hypothetical protein [bacterium]